MIFCREEEAKPAVLGVGSVGKALALHIGAFLLLYLFAMMHLKPREQVIPIDLSVVVNENLDGKDDEPPPLRNEKPPEPKPRPPEPKPEPPPKTEEKVEAVEQIAEKPKKPEPPKEKPKPKEPEKPKEAPKPEAPKPPEKTPEQIREERLRKMRESASEVKKAKIEVAKKPSGNGRTERQTMSKAEIEKLLNQGYSPGKVTQLAASEEQRCISLIREAFYSKWNRPPWTDTLREMHLRVQFDMNGRVRGFRLVQSSGDAGADATVRQAASLVHMVSGLSTDFLSKNPEVTIRFKVTPQ